MQTYRTLMQAVSLLQAAQLELWRSEGDSPAWVKLIHAKDYLKAQAGALLSE